MPPTRARLSCRLEVPAESIPKRFLILGEQSCNVIQLLDAPLIGLGDVRVEVLFVSVELRLETMDLRPPGLEHGWLQPSSTRMSAHRALALTPPRTVLSCQGNSR